MRCRNKVNNNLTIIHVLFQGKKLKKLKKKTPSAAANEEGGITSIQPNRYSVVRSFMHSLLITFLLSVESIEEKNELSEVTIDKSLSVESIKEKNELNELTVDKSSDIDEEKESEGIQHTPYNPEGEFAVLPLKHEISHMAPYGAVQS